jgi:hypothetical protein
VGRKGTKTKPGVPVALIRIREGRVRKAFEQMAAMEQMSVAAFFRRLIMEGTKNHPIYGPLIRQAIEDEINRRGGQLKKLRKESSKQTGG